MSNPNFPGSSWQDPSPSADLEPYGRHPADRPGSYGRSPDYPGRPGYDASDGAANGRRHRSADGATGGGYQGYDARRGYPGEGNGRDQAGRGGNGQGRHGANGDGYGRPGANGDGDASGYGRSGSARSAMPRGRGPGAGGAHGRGGYASEDRYGNGRGGGASYDSGRGDHDPYGGNGRTGYGRGEYGRGGYGGNYDPGADQYTVGVTDEELYRPTGSAGTDDRGSRERGLGRNARAYEDSERPPDRPPGNWLQRQWHARWWRHWTIKKAAFLAGALVAAVVLVFIGGFFYAYSSIALPLQALAKPPVQSSMVFFSGSKGKLIGCFCSQNRNSLDWSHIAKDPYLTQAFFAAEDRNFMHEGGISMTGTARALLVDLSGGGSQGGSTITEQFIKSYLVPSGGGLTFKEKIKEIVMAIKLAKSESKSWILTHYLNVIYLGNSAFGVQAAAQTYFQTNAWSVDIGQAAMLAAMVQQPSAFDPAHPGAVVPGLGYSLLDRWIYVINNMARDNAITQQQMNELVPYPNPNTSQQIQADLAHFPKVHLRPESSYWPSYRLYIMDMVQNELEAYYHIPASQISSLGLQVHTSISQRLMNGLYNTISEEKALVKQLGGVPMPRWIRIGAVVEKPGTGQIVALYGGPGNGVKHCKALACQFNTALDAQQVGSSFKPYVLATAVSMGMNAKTSILDSHSPICIPPADDGIKYQMQLSTFGNANCDTPLGFYALNQPGENYKQSLTAPAATAFSSNPAYEDLIHRTSVYKVLDMAKTLGVSESTYEGLEKEFGPGGAHPGSVTAALGAGELTPVDQANTFATLVSDGWSAVPHIITSVYENGVKLPTPAIYTRHRVLTPYQAADTDYALSWDTRMPGATGVPNAVWNRPMVAKTGTLGSGVNSSQAWFVGAIPQYSMSVALFTDKPAKEILDGLPALGPWTGGYGGAWPAHIWHRFMSQEFNNLPIDQLPPTNFNAPAFTKWVQVKPMKQKKCQQPPSWFGGGGGNGGGGGGNGGGGNGNGHHHHGLPGGAPAALGQKQQCKKGGSPSPSPSPSPSSSGSPSSSPTPTPSPSGSPSPSPSPSGKGARHAAVPGPQPVPRPRSVAGSQLALDIRPAPGPRPAPSPQRRFTALSLTAAAVLQRPPYWRPPWTSVATGRR